MIVQPFLVTVLMACDLKLGLFSIISSLLIGKIFLERIWIVEDQHTNYYNVILILIMVIVVYIAAFFLITYVIEM